MKNQDIPAEDGRESKFGDVGNLADLVSAANMILAD